MGPDLETHGTAAVQTWQRGSVLSAVGGAMGCKDPRLAKVRAYELAAAQSDKQCLGTDVSVGG
jgi:hypothetical protein